MTTPPPYSIDIAFGRIDSKGHTTVAITLPDGEKRSDSVTLGSSRSRDRFVAEVCRDQNEDSRNQIRRKLEEEGHAHALQSGSSAPETSTRDTREVAKTKLNEMSDEVKKAAQAMLLDPTLIDRIVNDIAELGVAGERELSATIYLVGTSRLLVRPCSARVHGPTASGKSYQIERVAELFPPECVIDAKQITPQALFYMEPGSLVHKFIVAGERSRLENDESAEATRALREMMSSGKLSKLVTIKDGGAMKSAQIEQDGPIAFIESTSLSRVFDEDANRCISLHTDERSAQTKRILRATAVGYMGGRSQVTINEIVQRHHAAQRMLEQLEVRIPFAEQLASLLSSERVEARRAIGHLLSMICSIALLHQFQRKRDAQGAVIATCADYQIARRLLDGPMAILLGNCVSPAAVRFLERLRTRVGDDTFATTNAYKSESVTDRAVRGWLIELEAVGCVEQTQPHRGSRPAQWRLLPDTGQPDTMADLPTLAQVFPNLSSLTSDNTQALVKPAPAPEVAGISGNVPTRAGSDPENTPTSDESDCP